MTADDFGLAIPINQAVEQAHSRGILTAASLMATGVAAKDAVVRARRLPSLAVGLHLVVVCGRPLLPRDQVPDLVGPDGLFSKRLVRAGFDYFLHRATRRQLEDEIRAQFQWFRDTGLRLDHVNAHKHMHLHPTILNLVLRVGRDFGLKALRVPYEPFPQAWRATDAGFLGRFGHAMFLAPWIGIMRRRAGKSNLACNDYLFGLYDSGRMSEERVLHYLANLPEGVSEIYFHPALGPWSDGEPPVGHYQYEQEFSALISPNVADALRTAGAERGAFGDLVD